MCGFISPSNRADNRSLAILVSEQQIAFILKRTEDGTTVEEVCRKAGISVQTFVARHAPGMAALPQYRWRSKYGGLMPSEMKRVKQLEEENVRLKRLVANRVGDRRSKRKIGAGHAPCSAALDRRVDGAPEEERKTEIEAVGKR